LLGHAPYAALVKKEALACFHAVYKFVQSCYYDSQELWPTVKDELRAFVGLIVSSWTLRWSDLVVASDSSLTGYGATEARFHGRAVAVVGRVRERDRFLHAGSVGARAAALKGLDPDTAAEFSAQLEFLSEEEAAGVEAALPDEVTQVDDSFPEVPHWMLEPERWHVTMSGTWQWESYITELEARALVQNLRRLSCCEDFRNLRQLMLADNMSVVLAFDRHRAREFRLLVQVRRYAAYQLVRNVKTVARWIPSGP